jgi:predicted dehydrogenase
VHVPALRAAGFDVVALVGRDADKTARRARRLGIEHSTTSLRDALARPGADVVTIATPPDTHAELAIEAADAGRHVICEKPFALDLEQARSMLDAARRAGIVHLVGHEFRWAEDRAVVGRAIAQGRIGAPRFCTLVQYVPLVADPATPTPDWWFDTNRGGGWLGASGSHLVDQLRVWLGEVARVSATLPVVSARAGVAEDSFSVRCTLHGGVEAVLQQTAASWAAANVGLTVVAGTGGTVGVDRDGPWIADRDGTRPLVVPPDLRLPDPPPESADPRARFTHLELGPYTKLATELRAAMEGRPFGSPVPVPTFEDGVAVTGVLDAVRASAAAGGALVDVAAVE